MRAVSVVISGLLAVGALSGCAEDGATGDGGPSAGPTATAPATDQWPPLPPGEEFDPEGYLPEGDTAPQAEPSARFPEG